MQNAYKWADAAQTVALRSSDGAFVPVGQPTSDSRALADYLRLGGVPDAADPAPVPTLADKLANSDALIFGLIDEVLKLLLTKGVVAIGDFSPSARAVIAARRKIIDGA